jgi:type I restriction enzyme S subunit
MSYKWDTVVLGDLLELIIDHRGKTPKKMGFDDFHKEGYPVLSAKHVKTDGLVNMEALRYSNNEMYKRWMKVEVKEGDIVLTSEAPLGEAFYINGKEKYVLGQRVFGLRPKTDLVEPLYLLTWLTSVRGRERLFARATGSTVLGIKQSELLKVEVDLPPKFVQKKIGQTRSCISSKITNNRAANQTLEAMAQAIFKSWFVDFDPVKAKMQGKQPEGRGCSIFCVSQFS